MAAVNRMRLWRCGCCTPVGNRLAIVHFVGMFPSWRCPQNIKILPIFMLHMCIHACLVCACVISCVHIRRLADRDRNPIANRKFFTALDALAAKDARPILEGFSYAHTHTYVNTPIVNIHNGIYVLAPETAPPPPSPSPLPSPPPLASSSVAELSSFVATFHG